MRTLKAMWHRLRGSFRRRALEREMNDEMEAHLDGLTERNMAAGMSPQDARFAALRVFGGVAQIAERARDERRSVWVEQLYQDLRYAVRSLKKSPSFTITAVVTLALGIGVNAALFSVVNMVALRPLPVTDPDGLVRIRGSNARGQGISGFGYAEYQVYRDGNRTLDELLASAGSEWTFESGSGAEFDLAIEGQGSGFKVPVEFVSDNYFRTLGGGIQFGRDFRHEEMVRGAEPVMVLSNVFWETRLQRDPDIIGATLRLNGQSVTVIGVASVEFSGHQPIPPAGWLPLQWWSSRPVDHEAGGPQTFRLVGRLKAGITEEQAKADLDAIASLRAKEFPGTNAKTSVRLERGLRFLNLTQNRASTVFMGMVIFAFGLVLTISCTNVANLLLARGVSRQPEIGVRLTLGAGRGRIIRQLLTENILLCVIGAVLGLGLATWTLQLLLPIVVSRLPVDWAMETRHLAFFKTTPDVRVLGFTALLTMGAAISAGLLPALHASSGNLIATVRNDGTAFGGQFSPSKLRRWLVIAQVAISVMLLSCAGLLARTFLSQQKADLGYDARAVFGVAFTPNPAIADGGSAFRLGLENVRGIPGVAACGVADPAPLLGIRLTSIRPIGASAGGAAEQVQMSFISDGFFDTFQIPLLRGRTFRELELQSASRSIIISETLARRLWPAGEAVGQTLAVSEAAWASRDRPAPEEAFRECTVIGVARDIMIQPVHDNRQLLYLPTPLDTVRNGPLFVRPRNVSASALAEIVRAAKAGGVDLHFERRHSSWVEFFVLPFYAFAIVSASLGALALGMASVGLYGLMTFAVNQRVHEIGVRMALGATTREVVTLFVRQGMRLVAVGLVLGLIGGGLFALLLGKILYGFVDPFDPVAFVTVTLLFAIIALFACWLPARRATRVDPMAALRTE